MKFKMSIEEFNALLPMGWRLDQYTKDGDQIAMKWSASHFLLIFL